MFMVEQGKEEWGPAYTAEEAGPVECDRVLSEREAAVTAVRSELADASQEVVLTEPSPPWGLVEQGSSTLRDRLCDEVPPEIKG